MFTHLKRRRSARFTPFPPHLHPSLLPTLCVYCSFLSFLLSLHIKTKGESKEKWKGMSEKVRNARFSSFFSLFPFFPLIKIGSEKEGNGVKVMKVKWNERRLSLISILLLSSRSTLFLFSFFHSFLYNESVKGTKWKRKRWKRCCVSFNLNKACFHYLCLIKSKTQHTNN